MNVEIKAKVRDLTRQREIAAQISNSGPTLLEQTDTFFKVQRGRLKLREFASGDAEVIQYQRPDRTLPAESCYSIVPVSRPSALKEALAAALGIAGVVKKRRYVYMVGQTRIHFDEVANLGDFIELEVVLSPEQTAEDGEDIARRLMQRLDIRDEDLIDRAYVDVLPGNQGDLRE